MVKERKEPTVSSTLSNNDGLGNKRPANPQRPQSPRQQVIIKKQSSFLLWFTFLLTLVAVAVAGYTFWLLFNSQQLISEQQIRINELENKLLLSDDESSQSLTALTANVKGLDKDIKKALSEVDKLWSTRNVNKKAITEAEKAFKSDLQKQTQSVASLQEKLKSLSSLQQRSSEQELLIQSLRERTSELSNTLSALSKVSKQNSTAAKSISSLKSKVNSYDEAIESFDKFRLTVNRDILLLKQRAGISSQ
jgi:chromosome segregation ATPase